MTYKQKRKIVWVAVAAVMIVVMVTGAVFRFRTRTIYADFRTIQCQLTDLGLFGEVPEEGGGLYCVATWVGEGYVCTVEQNGKTGECISVPYVEWIMYDAFSDTNGGEGNFRFWIAERTILDGKMQTGKSPYQYSNVTLTLVVGEQTGIRGCSVLGNFSYGKSTMENGDKVWMDVAVLDEKAYRTPDEAETAMNLSWHAYEFTLNDGTTFDTEWSRGVQVRLTEKRNWLSPSYHLSGHNAAEQMVLGVSFDMGYVNRLHSDEVKFPQTAWFKITYDVKNTVTGECTTKSTGWISQNYTARIH